MTRTFAIIPARAGSKGLPRKNVLPLGGIPLIEHSIRAASQCSDIDQVVVTSDGDEILEVAKKASAHTIRRPDHLAQDDTPTDPVLRNAFEELGIYTEDASICVLLQPTSPLRNHAHVTEAIDLFRKSDCDAVISVKPAAECPFKAFSTDKDGFLTGHFGQHAPFSRRQDFPEVCFANGAIYVFTIGSFKRNGDRIPRQRAIPYYMSTRDSIDIDSLQDMRLAELFLKGNLNA